jgi:hypothetical protein
LADVAPLLDRLPILAGGLTDTPQRALRAWFVALQLEISYQPGDQALDVALTLCDNISDQVIRQETSEDWSVHPAIHNAHLSALIPAEHVALSTAHSKVRRDGYRSDPASWSGGRDAG